MVHMPRCRSVYGVTFASGGKSKEKYVAAALTHQHHHHGQ